MTEGVPVPELARNLESPGITLGALQRQAESLRQSERVIMARGTDPGLREAQLVPIRAEIARREEAIAFLQAQPGVQEAAGLVRAAEQRQVAGERALAEQAKDRPVRIDLFPTTKVEFIPRTIPVSARTFTPPFLDLARERGVLGEVAGRTTATEAFLRKLDPLPPLPLPAREAGLTQEAAASMLLTGRAFPILGAPTAEQRERALGMPGVILDPFTRTPQAALLPPGPEPPTGLPLTGFPETPRRPSPEFEAFALREVLKIIPPAASRRPLPEFEAFALRETLKTTPTVRIPVIGAPEEVRFPPVRTLPAELQSAIDIGLRPPTPIPEFERRKATEFLERKEAEALGRAEARRPTILDAFGPRAARVPEAVGKTAQEFAIVSPFEAGKFVLEHPMATAGLVGLGAGFGFATTIPPIAAGIAAIPAVPKAILAVTAAEAALAPPVLEGVAGFAREGRIGAVKGVARGAFETGLVFAGGAAGQAFGTAFFAPRVSRMAFRGVVQPRETFKFDIPGGLKEVTVTQEAISGRIARGFGPLRFESPFEAVGEGVRTRLPAGVVRGVVQFSIEAPGVSEPALIQFRMEPSSLVRPRGGFTGIARFDIGVDPLRSFSAAITGRRGPQPTRPLQPEQFLVETQVEPSRIQGIRTIFGAERGFPEPLPGLLGPMQAAERGQIMRAFIFPDQPSTLQVIGVAKDTGAPVMTIGRPAMPGPGIGVGFETTGAKAAEFLSGRRAPAGLAPRPGPGRPPPPPFHLELEHLFVRPAMKPAPAPAAAEAGRLAIITEPDLLKMPFALPIQALMPPRPSLIPTAFAGLALLPTAGVIERRLPSAAREPILVPVTKPAPRPSRIPEAALQIQVFRPPPARRLAPLRAPSLAQLQGPALSIVPVTAPVTAPITAPLPISAPIQAPVQVPAAGPVFPGLPVEFLPTPARGTPFFIFPGLTGKGEPRPRRRKPPRKGFQPSLAALALGIRGRPQKGLITGAEIRPVPRKAGYIPTFRDFQRAFTGLGAGRPSGRKGRKGREAI